MAACLNNRGPTGPGDSASSVYTYTASGNGICISRPLVIETWCNRSTLVSDTIPAHVDTMQYALFNGDSLLILYTSSWGDTLIRIGNGSGIQGQWDRHGMTVQIDGRTITETHNWADEFMAMWAGWGSQYYNITAVKVSALSVSLTGNITHEVVTITWNSAGDETCTSDNPQHARTVWYRNPTSCPNETGWVGGFFNDHQRSIVYKTTIPAPSAAPHNLLPFSTKRRF